MMFNSNQFFLVTGASSGIGASVALDLNAKGASVVCISRNEELLFELKSNSIKSDNFYIEIKDLAENISGLPEYVSCLKNKYGKFQGLAFCAGIVDISPLRALDAEKVRKVFEINYLAPLFMTKGFLDKRNNNGKNSAITVIASAGAIHCEKGMSAYAGSKGALIASMQSIAREYAPYGIRVNCVSPSLINTKMADDIALQFADGRYPMGIGNVKDVSNLIIYLLSEDSKWISAQNYIVDCGSL